MAVKERGRSFDAKQGTETVVLEDSFGRQHVMSIHVAPGRVCLSCGHPLEELEGFGHVEAAIERAKKHMAQSEKKMRRYQRMRKP